MAVTNCHLIFLSPNADLTISISLYVFAISVSPASEYTQTNYDSMHNQPTGSLYYSPSAR